MKAREIKFRMWNKKDVYMEELSFPWMIDHEEVWNINTKKQLKNVVLMQYTGIKDKNGEDIYEGDIIKWGIEGGEWINEVRFYGGAVWIFVDGEIHTILSEYRGKYEVVGNIYENPELIKKKRK